MENKINASALAAMIALATGQPGELCENFLRELFQLIAANLIKGENVRIKGLGTFKVVDVEARKSVDVATGEENEIPAHKRVIFVAAKQLAAQVNYPFEMFEAVEVSDALPSDRLSEGSELSDALETDPLNMISFEEGEYFDEEDPESADGECDVEEEYDEFDNVTTPEDVQTTEEPSDRLQAATIHFDSPATSSEPDNESVVESVHHSKFGSGFLTGFLSAVALIALVAVLCVKFDAVPEKMKGMIVKNDTASTITSGNDENVTIVVPDSIATDTVISQPEPEPTQQEEDTVDTKPSDEPVYDTVSTTRYLTTMAKEHYGNFNLWPVIYEENKKILGHPDRIKPGTKVVIPKLSKYNVDPSNPEDVKRIKQQGNDIYARYKR